MPKIVDISHQKFNKLTAIEKTNTRNPDGSIVWLFRCDCGKEKFLSGSRVKSGAVKSCGCLIEETSRKLIKKLHGKRTLPHGFAALNALYSAYKYGAKKRGLAFELTIEQFKQLCEENCSYCGVEPKQIAFQPQMNGSFTYNGIDRVNNTEGYYLQNAVPCCRICNMAKGTSTSEEFRLWIQRLVKKNGT
jgi:hypothetical protein